MICTAKVILKIIYLQVVNTQETSDSRLSLNDDKTQMTSKPKLSGMDVKKHKTKLDEPRITDSFHELFGTPITKTSKISPDSKPKETNKNVAKVEKGNINNNTYIRV